MFRSPETMKANLQELEELNNSGRVFAHNNGPPPELVIKLFRTKPEIWQAELLSHNEGGVIHYSLPTLIARERGGEHVQDFDIKNAVEILDEYFYASDALKIQAGQEFGRQFRNRPPLIFLWWD